MSHKGIDLEELYAEGKKFFPKLLFKEKKGSDNEIRAFVNYPKNKGSYSISSFANTLTSIKLGKLSSWLREKGFKVVVSNTTNSIYFKHNGIDVRISDHGKKTFDGINILFRWNTTGQDIVNQLKNKSVIQEMLNNRLSLNECKPINLTDDMKKEISKFKSDEEFLRAGGFSIETLDRAAYGFSDEDIKTLLPNQLKIKWRDDMDNVIWEQNKSGLSKVAWANKIDLSEPIDVVYEKNNFYIDDGHHRFYAAKILNKPLNVRLIIKQNPITTIGYDDYDKFHRCAFKQFKSQINENLISKSAKGNRYFKMLETGLFQHYDSPKGELSPIGDDDDRKRLVSKLSKEDKAKYKEWLKTDEGKASLKNFNNNQY